MGLFTPLNEEYERDAQEERIEEMKKDISEKGLSNIVNERNHQKLIIEQNQAIISLLATNAVVNGGTAGTIKTLVDLNMYYESIERLK